MIRAVASYWHSYSAPVAPPVEIAQNSNRAYTGSDGSDGTLVLHGREKEWLPQGAIPDDDRLAGQWAAPDYDINTAGKLVIESKAEMARRGEANPDDGDALALTFARPVARLEEPRRPAPIRVYSMSDYAPYA